MLDQATKRKIDTARQILVGKVPDPKAQVEQITTALIYKFMDDMDKQNEEVGLKAQFFTDEYSQYAWTKLLDNKLSGQERLDLYVQALSNIPKNSNIPQLFRDIFKNSFLPFRDPRTLTLFLKEINEFTYDNSENLGNAFEYLLSIMGSQGDAGQFRTPRHIIDFIVQVIAPKKNETILDPACGTAGFLISAYKEIKKQHDGKDNITGKPTKKEKQLTPTEKKKMMNNFVGYDISPDMVKLSLVNMYLHGFPKPNIFEYDTLSSEKRWDETFDVILANPPFMTPKGGITPHKRFSIKANRAEVLFVDYIAEHLNINGRAGIIVPEGIIFQNTNAYKNLRKNLVENWGLYAVVSLPAGVFQPYSGVKTSILLLDKALAKQVNHILFAKALSDGYDLGAQRKPTPHSNDLTLILDALSRYKKHVDSKGSFSNTGWPEGKFHIDTHPNIQFVSKKELSKNGDYDLSGQRYTTSDRSAKITGKWPMVKLEEMIDYEQPTNYIVNSTKYDDKYRTPVLTAGKTFVLGHTNETKGVFPVKKLPVTIFDDFTTAIKFVDFPFKVKSSAMKILLTKKEKADPKFVFYMMQNIKFDASQHKRYWISQYSKIQIPLPPLKIQNQIVAELNGYQKIINGAKQVVESWKPSVNVNPLWKKVNLGDVCNFIRGPFGGSLKKEIFKNKGYLVYEQYHAINNDFSFERYYIDKEKFNEMKRFKVSAGDLLMSCSGTMGKIAIIPTKFKEGIINQALLKLTPHNNLDKTFLKLLLETKIIQSNHIQNTAGSGIKNIASVKLLKQIEIPFPPSKIQKQIVKKIKAEQKLVDSNKKLIKIYQQKIENRIDKIWGKK